jgi:hypothetical protein
MRRVMAVTLAASALVVAGSVVAANGAVSKTVTVKMTGAAEKPKGSPTGKGTFKWNIDTTKHLFCYSMAWSGIDTGLYSHIHKGGKGVAGNVVIPLSAAAPVAHHGCVKAKASLLSAILKKPSGYYANLHTKKYPLGALRAQL